MSELFLRLQTLANIYHDRDRWEEIEANYGPGFVEELQKSILDSVEELEENGINLPLCANVRQFVRTGTGLDIPPVSEEQLEQLEKSFWEEALLSPHQKKLRALREIKKSLDDSHNNLMSSFRSNIAKMMRLRGSDPAAQRQVVDGLQGIYEIAAEALEKGNITPTDLEEVFLLIKGQSAETIKKGQREKQRLTLLDGLEARVKEALRTFANEKTAQGATLARQALDAILAEAKKARQDGVFTPADLDRIAKLVGDAKGDVNHYYKAPTAADKYAEAQVARERQQVWKEVDPRDNQIVQTVAREETYLSALRKHQAGQIDDNELAEIGSRLSGLSKDEMLRGIYLARRFGSLYDALL